MDQEDNQDENDFSPEQLEKIVQFQEITGSEDVSLARLELSQYDWNVEPAVQNHLMLRDSPTQSPRRSNIRSNAPSSDESPIRNGRIIPHRSFIYSMAWPFRALYQWGFFFLSLPLRIFYASLSSVYRLVVPDPLRVNPLGDIVAFVREYESEYGLAHPSFFQGSYSQALNHAKMELKFLLVYLHSRDHQDTAMFCGRTLSDPSVIEFVNSTMIFWSCSVTTGEGYRVSQALRENAYPFLAVIVLRDNRMSVVGRIEGLVRPNQLIQQIQAIIRDNEGFLVVARADRQEREMTAALRQEQDVAYLESLRVDQEKARKRLEEQQAQTKLLEAELLKERLVVEEKEKRLRLKIEWADRVPPEPEEGAEEGVVHIVAKLPQGSRLERRFHVSGSLDGLYYYIFCHPDSPDRFQVTTNFPRKPVPCEPSADNLIPPSFQDFGLEKRSLLFVIDLDA